MRGSVPNYFTNSLEFLKKFGKAILHAESLRYREYDFILKQIKHNQSVLDAGCGTGVSTDYLAHLNPGSEILAIDISKTAKKSN